MRFVYVVQFVYFGDLAVPEATPPANEIQHLVDYVILHYAISTLIQFAYDLYNYVIKYFILKLHAVPEAPPPAASLANACIHEAK